MKNFRPDFIDKMPSGRNGLMALIAFICCVVLEITIWTTLFSVFTENIRLANTTYLTDLPIVGAIFNSFPDANASHLISALMALFCTAVPIMLWSYIEDEKVFANFEAWIQYPQNQFYCAFGVLMALTVIGLEALNLYELISNQAAQPVGFVQTQEEAGLKKWLAENKGMAVAASLILTLINFLLALMSVRTFHNLKKEEKS